MVCVSFSIYMRNDVLKQSALVTNLWFEYLLIYNYDVFVYIFTWL